MRKGILIVVAVVSLMTVAGSVFAAPKAEEVTYTGYLMDKACADMGKGMDGSDIVNSPQDHSKMCLLAEPCVESGYGVWFKADSGEYEFLKFDKKSDQVALDLINGASRENNFEIEVVGKMKNDVLVVSDIALN
jgi:hypothetical protein